MPAGVDREALYGWMVQTFGEDAAKAWWKWFSTDHRGWGQEGWSRLDKARANCP